MHRPPPHPMNEEERLAVLRRYRILDTDPEPQFDRIVEIAKRHFDVPIALVAFMDSDRNFLKARGGLPTAEAPRDISFCGHTILGDDVLVVPDATKDERFAENPLVTEDAALRFYAGAPLVHQGQRIGTVCVFDTRPREFGEEDRKALEDLAGVVSDHLEMRLAVGNVHDEIETRRKAEAEVSRLAFYDALTGLPNRNSLNNLIQQPDIAGDTTRHAVYANLDDFKYMNDVLGHDRADVVLQQTAAAIEAAAGTDAFVARVGGDEFLAVIKGRSDAEIDAIAANLLAEAGKPRLVGARLFSWGLSLGIAGAHGADADLATLLRRADLALMSAKRAGGKRAAWYDHRIALDVTRRRRLSADIGEAIQAGAIEVHYQTIHEAADRRIIGVEALARWNHPEFGRVSPLEFVAIAEENGQIIELGKHVLQTAVGDASAWPDLFVAVNLSPVQFRMPEFADRLLACISEKGFPAERLQFEITESVLLNDFDLARQQIAALQAHGIRVALDDFGTGYASLSYLTSIPFDKIKIDRSFVNGLEGSPVNTTIVQHIIHLARQLDMRVTAEGVETEHQEVMLRAAGCNSFQGYRFGKPVPAAEIDLLLMPATPARRAAS